MSTRSRGRTGRSSKRVWVLALAALLVLSVPGCAIGVGMVNNANAAQLTSRITALLPAEDARVLDSFSEVGRWAPAGNGTQYLAGVIVESDLAREELAERMRSLGDEARPELRLSVTGVSDAELTESHRMSALRERISRVGAAPNRFVISTIESPDSSLLSGSDIRGH
ncbi:hypothetical protein JD292_03600 [Leucobacter sp. CSA2]|uniref:Uncharacterized protein n=1 Tax=Leucobacter edaphi TaxID=2796472 RepID=A0A934QAV4_9MICO|nr:hypothetical protein [Leucobacter edaphi]MBK0421166.1 hypothetical protein [Leucobacter edaphi]